MSRARIQQWWRRRPEFRAMVVAHRWPGLVLGLLLVIECTSGAILLYRTEIFWTTNSALYQHTASTQPITPAQAIADVRRAHPGFGASWVAIDHRVYAVGEPTYAKQCSSIPEQVASRACMLPIAASSHCWRTSTTAG